MNEENRIKSFTDLIVWQKCHQLVLEVYKLTEKFPSKEVFSLTDQMRRAAVSITSNIAEGFGRQTYKEKIQFYYVSSGSISELKNQIMIAKDLDYIKPDKILYELCNDCHRLINGLISASKRRK